MARVVTRLFFVVSLLVFGFSAEVLLQSVLHREEGRTNKGSERILLIGGSMANGLASRVQRHLRLVSGREDFAVVDLSTPLMSVHEAELRVRRALDEHRPSHVLLMVGQHEELDRPEWLTRIEDRLREGDEAGVVKLVGESLDAADYTQPLLFVMRNSESMKKDSLRESLFAELRRRIDPLAKRAPDDHKTRTQALQLVRLGNYMFGASKFTRDMIHISPAALPGFVQNLNLQFRQFSTWSRRIETEDYDSFTRVDDFKQYLTRAWFWMTWPRDGRDHDPVEYYSSHPQELRFMIHVPLQLYDDEAIEKYFSDPMFRTLIRETVELERKQPHRFPTFDMAKFQARVANLLETISKGGSRAIFLHYPGARLPLIDELSRRFDVPTVGGKSNVLKLAKRNGTAVYFLDYGYSPDGTAHLTDAGLEIYGREVAEDLHRLMD